MIEEGVKEANLIKHAVFVLMVSVRPISADVWARGGQHLCKMPFDALTSLIEAL